MLWYMIFFVQHIFFQTTMYMKIHNFKTKSNTKKNLTWKTAPEVQMDWKKIWLSDFPMWFYQSNQNASNLYVSQILRAHLIWYQSTAWTKYTENRHAHFTRKHVLSLRCLLMIKTNCHFISNLHCFIFLTAIRKNIKNDFFQICFFCLSIPCYVT